MTKFSYIAAASSNIEERIKKALAANERESTPNFATRIQKIQESIRDLRARGIIPPQKIASVHNFKQTRLVNLHGNK